MDGDRDSPAANSLARITVRFQTQGSAAQRFSQSLAGQGQSADYSHRRGYFGLYRRGVGSLFTAATKIAGPEVEALSSTDIVSHPRLHLNPLQPTLIVSYGRSGNSPESLAVLALADELLTDVSHLLLTCNPEGALASYAAEHSHKACLWLMPQDSHDRSFAMTSSFSCMYLATLLLFAEEDKSLSRVLTLTEQLLETGSTGCSKPRAIAASG